MEVVYEILAIVNKYLVHHCWMQRAVNTRDGLRHIVLTIDVLQTNAALPRLSGSQFDHR